MPNINISVRDKIPTVQTPLVLVTDNSGYTLTFDFDREWDDYRYKTVIVADENGAEIEKILMDGNTCSLTALGNKLWRIKIGVTAGDIITTTPCDVRILPSILSFINGRVAPPPEDIYSQIMELLNQLKEGEISDEDIQKAVNAYLELHPVTISPATDSTLGGIIVGENLTVTESGVLSVDTTDEMVADNTKPITAAGVNVVVGDIGSLLATI